MTRILRLAKGVWFVALSAGLTIAVGLPSHLAMMPPLSTATPTQPETQGRAPQERLVNAPYDVPGEEAAVFWFGRVTPTENSVDARVTYNDRYLWVHVAIFDRRLWYDQSPSPETLTDWDSVSLYVSTDGNTGIAPGPTSYRFDAQLVWWEARDDYQTAYRGNGSDWITATLPFTTTSFWRGEVPNHDIDDRGWAVTYYVPFKSLGLPEGPASFSTWGMGLAVHDRDDLSGSPIADQIWPESMDPQQPATWGQLVFGMPEYAPPPAEPAGTVTIRHGLDGANVPDADVGGSSICGAPAWPDYFPTWGELNWAGKTFINIQNLGDIGDWPCFSRYYVTFPLDAVPSDQVIISATLTLHLWGSAGQGYDPGPRPSLIQMFTVGEDWDESTLTWNNAPLARENVSATWVDPVDVAQDPPGLPYHWDVSRAAAQAHAAGIPLRLALYEADFAYHSGKYFYSSDQDEWNALGRPSLALTVGRRIPGLEKRVTPTSGRQNEPITYTLSFLGTGQPLTLSDMLPTDVSAPEDLTIVGSSVVPTYSAKPPRLTWEDTPPVGQNISIRYTVTVSTAESKTLVNVAELQEEGGNTKIATATFLANPERTYLPQVSR